MEKNKQQMRKINTTLERTARRYEEKGSPEMARRIRMTKLHEF